MIPEGAGQSSLQAGFGQIEAQVLRPGMVAEAACNSMPWTVIPMVVTGVQDYIAAGQFRGGDQLLEAQSAARPGTLLVFLEPLYKGGLEGVTAGKQLHRQRLYQQPRADLVRKGRGGEELLVARGRCRWACSRPAVADSGAGAADQDAGLDRPLALPKSHRRLRYAQAAAVGRKLDPCQSTRRPSSKNGRRQLTICQSSVTSKRTLSCHVAWRTEPYHVGRSGPQTLQPQ